MYTFAKPAGAACNMRCEYCYYLEKKESVGAGVMSDETLEAYIKAYIGCQLEGSPVLFTWHGGEPLLRGLKFYEKVVRLQEKYADGRHIDNCIQTNGTLIDREWGRFFRREGWLVGVSVDGPEEIHDEFRRKTDGGPTWRSVMRGIETLQRHGVEWNAMSVVTDFTAEYPEDYYDFFGEIGCKYIQFEPIVERKKSDGRLAACHEAGELTDYSVGPAEWGEFLCRVFDRWVHKDVGSTFIQMFDATLANYAGVAPGICSLSTACGHAPIVEQNGDVYACDHFVFPEYRLGNVKEERFETMMIGERHASFAKMKNAGLPGECRRCAYLFACHGECPKNRFAKTTDGEEGLNYLCVGYKRYFEHTAPYFIYMKELLDKGLPPADVMAAM